MAIELYEKYCRNNNVHIDTKLLSVLGRAVINGELSLSGMTISAPSCDALAYTISNSQTFSRMDLSNCLLPPSELGILFDGLVYSGLNYLNLKGNNIFGAVTSKLSRFLMKNTSLKILILEWNNIGTPLISFSQLCNALLNNVSLEYLDLRNNALNAECSVELADVITRNTRLKEIDLRWNNLGTESGQLILKALHSNKTLQDLKVQGNSMSSELVIAIDEIVKNNNAIENVKSEYAARHDVLTKQLRSINQTRINEVKSLCEQTTQQLQPALDQLKDYANEKKLLVQEIEEQKIMSMKLEEEIYSLQCQLEQTTLKLQSSEAALVRKDEQVVLMKEEFDKEKLDIKNKFIEKETLLKEEAKSIEECVEKEKVEREKLNVSLLESKSVIESLQEELTTLKSKLQYISSLNTKLIEEERQLHTKRVDDLLEEMKQQQNRAKMTMEELQQESGERIGQLENKVKDLEVSKSEMAAEFLSAKTSWIEERSLIAAQAVEKQMSKLAALTESLEKSAEEKQKLEKELASAQSTLAGAQKENHSLKFDQMELNCKFNQLQEKLSDEKATVQQIKSELCEAKCRKNVLQQDCVKHKNDLENAQQQLIDFRNRHDLLIADHKQEIEKMNCKLNEKIEEISSIRAEELERVRTLCAAIHKYVGGT